jgi:hypothetical protein
MFSSPLNKRHLNGNVDTEYMNSETLDFELK